MFTGPTYICSSQIIFILAPFCIKSLSPSKFPVIIAPKIGVILLFSPYVTSLKLGSAPYSNNNLIIFILFTIPHSLNAVVSIVLPSLSIAFGVAPDCNSTLTPSVQLYNTPYFNGLSKSLFRSLTFALCDTNI